MGPHPSVLIELSSGLSGLLLGGTAVQETVHLFFGAGASGLSSLSLRPLLSTVLSLGLIPPSFFRLFPSSFAGSPPGAFLGSRLLLELGGALGIIQLLLFISFKHFFDDISAANWGPNSAAAGWCHFISSKKW